MTIWNWLEEITYKKSPVEYFNVLGKPKIKNILSQMGFEKKEITKLLKA